MKYIIAGLVVITGLTASMRAQTATAPTTQLNLTNAIPSTSPATQLAGVTTRPATQAAISQAAPAYTDNRRFAPRDNPVQLTSNTGQPRRITNDFYPVLNRSIFLKGSQRTTEDRSYSAPPSFSSESSQERNLVFNGVTQGDIAVAMIENTDSHEVTRLRVGDQIARGKIVAISLDNLSYEVNGRVVRIEIGQTLAGGATTPTIMGALTSPAAAGTTQPSNLPVGRQLGESVEAYLRRRRAMGL